MFNSAPLIMRLVSHSIRVSETAGKIIRRVLLDGDLAIVEKGINNIQTLADRAAQHCIIGSIRQKFSDANVSIIGEEGYHDDDLKTATIDLNCDVSVLSKKCPDEWRDVPEEKITIWVDPLDGTSEFSQSLKPGSEELREHVTVLIGFAVGSQPVAGIIHQPFYHRNPNCEPGRTIWGIDGLGAFGADFKPPPEGERIITTTRSHSSPEVENTINAMNPTTVMRVGGAGNKVMLVIEGRAHAYVFASPGCKKWDTCAPEAVLRASGGILSDISGQRIEYHSNVAHRNSGGVLATSTTVDHQWYLDRVSSEVKQQLSAKMKK